MTSPSPSSPDWVGCCPLCGNPNQCAITLGQPPQSCWCMTTPVNPAALATLPEAERGLRCICPACAQGAVVLSP